jgi:hypothetical protein
MDGGGPRERPGRRDPDARQLVLFGGSETNGGWNAQQRPLDQTWTFDGQQWTMRGGHALPKLPPPATPPPPPPCDTVPAMLHVSSFTGGSVFLSLQIPDSGPPGSCASVAASLRLETPAGRLLVVTGNPGSLGSVRDYGGPGIISASWINWCGRRTGVVARLVGAGFDISQPIPTPPPCTASGRPSSLYVMRPVAMP